jgi:hypothetical protein
MVVRIFARHLMTLDPATEGVLPHHYWRVAPICIHQTRSPHLGTTR